MKKSCVVSATLLANGQDVFLSKALPKSARPNIVMFLTDDQDQTHGGSFPAALSATPMPKTKKLMEDGGLGADNFYIHTPICAPSRAELLTGRYFHNVKQVGGKGYCAGMHINSTLVNNNTFARILSEEAGYTVGYFGKYVNEAPDDTPPGFDAWFANGGGSYIAPKFRVANVDGLPDGDVQFTNAAENYSTSVIGNYSIAWINKVAKQGKPFFAYIAPKAPHEPFNPAPWYAEAWDESWPDHEPRDATYNCSFESRRNHHEPIPSVPLLTENSARMVTGVFKNRWRTLMSVDDLISDVFDTIDELGLRENTYFFFTSDHGFQMGNFNMVMDKRLVYEWDTKIHLLVAGPGIKPGSRMTQAATQVDLAPTFLGLAGVAVPGTMDGKSLVPFLLDSEAQITEHARNHLEALGDLQVYHDEWRQEVFIEYYYCNWNVKCVNPQCKGDTPQGKHRYSYPQSDGYCTTLTPGNNTDCWCQSQEYPVDPAGDCIPVEDPINNFLALRRLQAGQNFVYAEYQRGDMSTADVRFDNISFVEFFDLDTDPDHMYNLGMNASVEVTKPISDLLRTYFNCIGSSCP